MTQAPSQCILSERVLKADRFNAPSALTSPEPILWSSNEIPILLRVTADQPDSPQFVATNFPRKRRGQMHHLLIAH